ncbi:hypothetical protein K488DRAFT_88366 [Vararia minispora EC-137]|uniref:Uncharacterized protein n=1 Tax=Vararia minispora EC-137 TaxID=1314806 RepID=A0ACB8QDP6_9AGAM|nr:hypothetical protein K488DRAFT_88366 [Vararia minispora EC-137]
MVTEPGVVDLSKNGEWTADDLVPPVLSKSLSDADALAVASISSSLSANASAAHCSALVESKRDGYHDHAEIKVASPADAPDAYSVPNPLADQFAVVSVLESGALFSGTWLTLAKSDSNQPTFSWAIVDTERTIRVEG